MKIKLLREKYRGLKTSTRLRGFNSLFFLIQENKS